MSTEIALLENVNIPTLFAGEGVDELLAAIEKEAMALVPDITTAKGRKAITANVSKVTKSKTYLMAQGADQVEDLKNRKSAIDSVRKKIKEKLEEIQKAARKQLTDWEDKEKKRIEALERGIEDIQRVSESIKTHWETADIDDMKSSLGVIKETKLTAQKWREYIDDATAAVNEAIVIIEAAIEKRITHDAQQKELAEFRADKEKREKEAAEEKLRQEGAEQVRKDAEAETERVKLEAEANAQKLIDDAQAEADRVKKVAQDAIDEQARIEAKEKEDQETREKDTEHRGKINNAAMKAIIDASKAYDSGENVITEGQAKLIIKIIANKKIPAVSIAY